MSGQVRAGDPGGSGWAGMAGEVAAAADRFEAAAAGLLAAAPGGIREALEILSAIRDLQAQVARLAWDEELARQEAERAYARGYADGVASRRRPRPRWPRPVS